MAEFQASKETTLPATRDPHTIYFVSKDTDFVEVYVTGTTGAQIRRIFKESDVQALINASLAASSNLNIVNTIALRDAINPTKNIQVLVKDASADSTVVSGSATYVYDTTDSTWTKISEHESMDVNFDWNNIANKPNVSVVDIEDAVSKKHDHTNKTELDQIGDSNGSLTYGGNIVKTQWTKTDW